MNPIPSRPCACCANRRDPLQCIIPPYVVDHLLNHPDAEVRKLALENVIAGAEMRAVRAALPAARPLGLLAASSAGKYREIYDLENGPAFTLPGKLIRVEGRPSNGDPIADEAYDHSGDTYDFYLKCFGRDSLDNHGLRLKSSVHVGKKFDNAFWNGAQMAYGDGDGKVFKPFVGSVEVVAHELTHGVVSYTADLVYQDEPGAINEHMADVFGTLVKQWKRRQTAPRANWLIGEGILTAAPTRKALRSMAAPGTAFSADPYLGDDPQPAHMKKIYTGGEDNGGVHFNSGIPNHAFYLAAMALGGKAWETVGPVWYEVLAKRLVRTSTFKDLARETIDVAGKRGAKARAAVKAAWKKVGL
jgi:Zn-dependent metalloprotease